VALPLSRESGCVWPTHAVVVQGQTLIGVMAAKAGQSGVAMVDAYTQRVAVEWHSHKLTGCAKTTSRLVFRAPHELGHTLGVGGAQNGGRPVEASGRGANCKLVLRPV